MSRAKETRARKSARSWEERGGLDRETLHLRPGPGTPPAGTGRAPASSPGEGATLRLLRDVARPGEGFGSGLQSSLPPGSGPTSLLKRT